MEIENVVDITKFPYNESDAEWVDFFELINPAIVAISPMPTLLNEDSVISVKLFSHRKHQTLIRATK